MAPALPASAREPREDVVMLFLGGTHQLFHLAPVAAALSRISPDTPVTCIATTPHLAELLHDVRDRMGAPGMRIETVEPPAWGRRLTVLFRRHSIEKLALLWSLARRLWSAATIVTAERTSAWLRILHLTRARMVHFRHGAGDRAPSSERRLRAFDLIVVPGEKDLERAVSSHHIDPARLRAGGYVKLDYLRQQSHSKAQLFDNDRLTILYNPHFHRATSSWNVAATVVERIRADGRYNLILAPHIRVAEDMDEAERASWLALAAPGRVIVDLDSDRLIDMTYVRLADIYLGDMSSQLYEFLANPRPVAFVNAHGVDWRHDEHYAGWHLGVVAERPEALIEAIDQAIAEHPQMVERQREAVRRAFGKIDGACERAANILLDAITRPNTPAPCGKRWGMTASIATGSPAP